MVAWPQSFESRFRLFYRFGGNPPQTIGNPVDVSVDADGLKAKGQVQDEIRCFSAYAWKLKQPLTRGRYAVVAGAQSVGNFEKLPRFGAVEGGRVHGLSNGFFG